MLNNYEQIVFSFIIIIFTLKNICFWFKSLLAFVFPMIGMPNMDKFWDKMDNFKRLHAPILYRVNFLALVVTHPGLPRVTKDQIYLKPVVVKLKLDWNRNTTNILPARNFSPPHIMIK